MCGDSAVQAGMTDVRADETLIGATAWTRIHFPKLGYELLGPQVFRGDLVSHGARDIPGEGVAIVNRSLPEPRTGLKLAYVRNNIPILGLVQHHAPTR